MEKTLQVLNRMQADGLLGQYAIGRAIAATFYVEPISTFDLDIFFPVAGEADKFLSLTSLYDYLAALGYEAAGEAVELEGWPVQFLPAFNPLLEEALAQAEAIRFKTTPHARHARGASSGGDVTNGAGEGLRPYHSVPRR